MFRFIQVIDQKPPAYNSIFGKKSRASSKNQKEESGNSKQLNDSQKEQKLQEPISYDSFMKARKAHVESQEQIQTSCQFCKLERYIIVHCVLLTILSFILISFQIFLISKNSRFSYIGAGIWVIFNQF
jgi:hypothetical protein